MKRTTGLLLVALVLCFPRASVLAHEEIYKGTVVAVRADKVQVKVLDDKTKKEASMEFIVTSKTKVLRGDKTVAFADARIQKDERIAVTVNHDASMTNATVIRLAATDGR